MKCILPVILALAFLQGCSTAYQSRGFSGGYSETQLDENIFKVSFSGNGYISGHKVADYTLLRSAELTLQNGFKYFAIVDANSNIEHSTYTSPTTYHTTGNVMLAARLIMRTRLLQEVKLTISQSLALPI